MVVDREPLSTAELSTAEVSKAELSTAVLCKKGYLYGGVPLLLHDWVASTDWLLTRDPHRNRGHPGLMVQGNRDHWIPTYRKL